MIIALLGGCSNEYVGDYDHQNSKNMLKVGNNRPHREIGIDRDQVTEQNPNFLNLNTDDETHVNNIGFAMEKVEYVLKINKQFRAGPVWRNGHDMYVTVYSDRQMSNQQARKASAQLDRELTMALPTYEIHVNIKNR